MTTGEKKHTSPRWPIYLSLGLVALAVVLYFTVSGFQSFIDEAWSVLTSDDRKRIEEWVSDFGAWGPVVIVLLMVFQMFLIVAPSWLLMVIAVLAYGPFLGALLSIVAVAVASTVGYGLGRMVGEHGLYRLLGRKKEKAIRRETERYGFWAVIVARLNPLFSNDAVSFIGGMLHMGFWKFLGATLAGILPLAIAIAVFGEDWESMKSGLLWLSLASLAGLVVKIWMDKRAVKGRREPREPSRGRTE